MRRMPLLSVLLLFVPIVPGRAQGKIPAEPSLKVAMPGVEGRIDHLAIDLKSRRLFVAALGNNTVEVIDLAVGKRTHSIPGLPQPQGIAYLAAPDRIVVACGGDGSCRVFDARTYRQTATIDCRSDADNVRLDAAAGRLYVGGGSAALAVIDPQRAARIAGVPLPGQPESFQLEAEANYPMALDETHHRLLIGCRRPARLLAIDTQTGKTAALLPCAGDSDDVFYDAKRKRVYVSGGEGSISVFAHTDAGHYRPLATIRTAAGARTSLLVPTTDSFYLAVPHRDHQEAAIWVYKLGGP